MSLHRGPDSNRQYVSVFIDDQNIAAKDQEGIQQIKDEIAESFDLSDLGEIKYLLG